MRAAISQGDDAIADRVLARRIRREVLTLCDAAIASGTLKDDETFWVHATQVEALLGLARTAESDTLNSKSSPTAAASAMDDRLHERSVGEAGGSQSLRLTPLARPKVTDSRAVVRYRRLPGHMACDARLRQTT